MTLIHTHAKGNMIVSSTQTGENVKVEKKRVQNGALTSKRGIEIAVMDPRLNNLGSLGVALVQAVRNAA